MGRPRNLVPTYRLHKASGRAICSVYTRSGAPLVLPLGKFGSAASRAEYSRVCAVLTANSGFYPEDADRLTLKELIAAYWIHCEAYYGPRSSSLHDVRAAMKRPKELFGSKNAEEFGPMALKSTMAAWVADGLSRKEVNRRAGAVKRMFKWAVAEELIPAEAHQRLTAVEGLRIGRTEAPDLAPVKPAAMADVDAALPFMPPPCRAMALLQVYSSARAGDLCILRSVDVDRSGAVWRYSPTSHKGSWRGHARAIFFGPKCQEILKPWLERPGFLFSPAASEAERIQSNSEKRQTPKWPSHMERNEKKRKGRVLGDRYTTASYRKAMERACLRAKVEVFTPHQLRHLAATRIRAEFGVDVARAMLGHSLAAVTEVYSREVDRGLAERAAAAMG